ncbi:hypothetical protein GCM10007418_02230 [Halopseudomonas salina]|uniref:Uncharacterized protein n=1 Tax=Halopseudomonas salina TaxID=1323744 RepID=A0ABQ1NW65_9GAMM|nr:hypothetical protein GCM10007418_02230 [Halopseudomonas salina]
MAMNWAEPANTRADMARVAVAESPDETARVPKIMPNGRAPTSIGMVSLAPTNADLQRGDMLWPFNDQASETTLWR